MNFSTCSIHIYQALVEAHMQYHSFRQLEGWVAIQVE